MLTSAVQRSVLCCLGVRSLRQWLAATVAGNHCSNQIVEPGSSSGSGQACGEKSSPELHLSFIFGVNSGTYWSATFPPTLTIKTANFICIWKHLNGNQAIPKSYLSGAKTKPEHFRRRCDWVCDLTAVCSITMHTFSPMTCARQIAFGFIDVLVGFVINPQRGVLVFNKGRCLQDISENKTSQHIASLSAGGVEV